MIIPSCSVKLVPETSSDTKHRFVYRPQNNRGRDFKRGLSILKHSLYMTMGERVYYIPMQRNGKNASNVFTWLGISPKKLQKRLTVDSGKRVIVYVQSGYNNVVDDISEVRKSLADYPQVTDASTIYIVAMSKHDNSDIHINDCVNAMMRTGGKNIIFFEIHCSYSGEIHNCMGNITNKKRLLSNLEQVKEEESMSDFVHYILKEREDMNPSKVFAWLGLSPKLLQKSPPKDSGNDVILYTQWGFSSVGDDIYVVRKMLPDYPQVTDTSSIYILAMSTDDDTNTHSDECVHAKSMTEGNIIFLEIHCSHDGKIHNCKGNNANKNVLRSKLKFVVEEQYQAGGSTQANTNIINDNPWKLILGVGVLIILALIIIKHR